MEKKIQQWNKSNEQYRNLLCSCSFFSVILLLFYLLPLFFWFLPWLSTKQTKVRYRLKDFAWSLGWQTEMQKFCCSFITPFVFLTTNSEKTGGNGVMYMCQELEIGAAVGYLQEASKLPLEGTEGQIGKFFTLCKYFSKLTSCIVCSFTDMEFKFL